MNVDRFIFDRVCVSITMTMSELKLKVVSLCESFAGDALRDVWTFDAETEESLFVRPDVHEQIEAVSVERFIDAERYGYITHDTYEALYYTEYEFTVRGMSEFEQYRVFVGPRDDRIGLLISFDPNDDGYNYRKLTQLLTETVTSGTIDQLHPTVDS